ncbi:MAG: histidinol-phosphate transaminase [Carbonactinosporaceae bacterium]
MTTPRLRAALDGIPTYKPGRPPSARTGVPTYKMASNENPYPPLPSVREAIERAGAQANRYPDMFATGLVAALAERFGVPREHISTGTGSVGLCQQLVQAAAGEDDEVMYAWRSFEAYPIIVRVAGARPVQVPLAGERHDLDAMAAAVTGQTRLVFVCNPNNPTGTAVHRDEVERFLDRVPGDVLVVFDEAYREFVRDPEAPDALDLYRGRPNVVVLRTFSKAYGLAGLRVGFAIAHEPVADALRKTAVPFGVSGVAQAAALASLQVEDELLARCESLVKERERVRAGLLEQGWQVPPSESNFVWLRLGEATADFAAACEQAGLSVRPFPGEGLRVTVGEPEAGDLLLGVAAAFPAP